MKMILVLVILGLVAGQKDKDSWELKQTRQDDKQNVD